MVRTKSLHITLAFLGAIPDMWIPHVCAVMRTVGEEQRQFSISMHGLRIFENERPVVWVGVRSSELSILRRDLIKKLRGVGIPVQGNKVWNPHITMGKILTGRATLKQEWNEKIMRSEIKKYEACGFGNIEICTIGIYEGVVEAGNKSYRQLYNVQLRGDKKREEEDGHGPGCEHCVVGD